MPKNIFKISSIFKNNISNILMNRYMGKLIDASLLPKTEDGFPCCRWCMKAVHPPRRTLCSKECEHELKLRISGKYLRGCVYKRDRAICALCNIDTKKIAQIAISLVGEERDNYLKSYNISLKRKYDNTKSENDSIIQVNNSISSERNTLKAKCSLLEKENKELVIVNNELKEKNSSLTDRYTKLDESYNAMLKRNRKV